MINRESPTGDESKAKGNILVVDDNPDNLHLLAEMLTEKGYKVRPAHSGTLAIKSALSALPDLVLLDIKMPEMDGYEVCRRLKSDERTRDVPVLFISALTDVMDKIKGFSVGGVDYITKPFQYEEVFARVETHIALRQMNRRLEEQNCRLQQEIIERKRLEKALMQKEKLKTLGTIAAEVAHEIRNPLVSIGGFAQRLKTKLPDLPECDIILSESHRLEKILLRIKNYLQPVEVNPRKCSADIIIADCVKLLSPMLHVRQVMCQLDLEPKLSSAYVDPDILSEIFINLISNAAEAMDKGGTLMVKTFEDEKEIHIEFKNQAPHLKIKDPEALFMPFAEGGHSFGLPLCYRLLEDMGGHLSFVQKEGFMVFTVSLPKTV